MNVLCLQIIHFESYKIKITNEKFFFKTPSCKIRNCNPNLTSIFMEVKNEEIGLKIQSCMTLNHIKDGRIKSRKGYGPEIKGYKKLKKWLNRVN